MTKIHWPIYIEYTGWYNACQMDDMAAKEATDDRTKKVTCKECLKYLKLKKETL